MASSSLPDGEYRNWAELPPELTSTILLRLGAVEILENAQKVCRSWRDVCKDPSMWRKIDMHNLGELENLDYDLEIMCRHAVDRSHGGLVGIDLWYFGTDHLLSYIADSSRNLKSLKLVKCYSITNKGFVEAVVKLPFLEDFELSYSVLSGDSLKVLGQSCPKMKTLKLNCSAYRFPDEDNDVALAIAETMPGLLYVQLLVDRLTDAGLNAILKNCSNLEHLDIRQCFNVKLVGELEKRCSERIRVFRRPNDSTHDYPYDDSDVNMGSSGSSDDDYRYGFSDIDLMTDDDFEDYYDGLSDASDHSDYDDEMLF